VTIDLSTIIAIISGLMVIIGALIIAVVHVYTMMIKNHIDKVSEHTARVQVRADSAHAKIKNHVKQFHLT